MHLLKAFETESHKLGMIPIFFHSRGYKLEAQTPESYTFKRGESLASLYSLDARKWGTRVEVSLKDLGKDRVRVYVSYHVKIKAVTTSLYRNKITTEMEALERFVGSRNRGTLNSRS